MLQRALPFEHGPAGKIVLRHLREDRLEVDLPVAERAKTSCTIDPSRVAAIHALSAVGPKLRVLHMKRLDARVIDIDEREVIEFLQHEVARIEQDVRARMIVDRREKAL